MRKLTREQKLQVQGGISLDDYCHQASMLHRFNDLSDEAYLIHDSFCRGNLYWY